MYRYLLLINLLSLCIGNMQAMASDIKDQSEILPQDTTVVSMGEGKRIELALDALNATKKSIFSFGFGGCIGVGIYILLNNNAQHAILTHYPPAELEDNILTIKNLFAECQDDRDALSITKATAVIMHPNWAKGSEIDLYAQRDMQRVNQLMHVIRVLLAGCVEEKRELYPDVIGAGLSDEYPSCRIFGDYPMPKEFELVLASNPQESYFQTKATMHKKQKFMNL